MYKNFSHLTNQLAASIDQVLDELELENNQLESIHDDSNNIEVTKNADNITDNSESQQETVSVYDANDYTPLNVSDDTVQEDRTTKYSDLDSLNIRSNFTNDRSSITVDDSSNDSDSKQSKSSSPASDTSTSSSNSLDCSSKSSGKPDSSSSSDESNCDGQNMDEDVANLLVNIEENSDCSEKASTCVRTDEKSEDIDNDDDTDNLDLKLKVQELNETASLSYTYLNNEQITESNVGELVNDKPSILADEKFENQEIEVQDKIEELKIRQDEIAPKEIKSESIEVVKLEPEKFVAVDLMDEGSEKKSMALGFESTMDDISDNELESFLQELEELEQEQQKQKICDKQSDKDTCDNISEASTVNINEPRIESLDTTMKTETGDYPGFTESDATENRSDVDLIRGEDTLASEPVEEASSANEMSETKSTNPDQPELEEIIEHTPERPTTLDIKTENDDPSKIQIDSDQGLTSTSSEEFSAMVSQNEPNEENSENSGKITPNINGIDMKELGQVPPFWVPDESSSNCMQCNLKFSVIKRRHHCRSCGLLLCKNCCSLKAKLPYLDDAEARICSQCDTVLKRNKEAAAENQDNGNSRRQPNPNNPMEYCSVVPPHEQVSPNPIPAMSVMVPVSVLKKRESNSSKSERKNVMFSDGIRPGCDLSELDENWNMKPSSSGSRSRKSDRVSTPTTSKFQANYPVMDERNKSFIPSSGDLLPPIKLPIKTEHKYVDVTNDEALIERLKTDELKFAVQKNFYVICKVIKLTCCINKTVINFTTDGLSHVGQDEIIILLELDDALKTLPKDIFLHLNDIYNDADQGKVIAEFGHSLAKTPNFLDSKDCGGFIYIRPSFQCLQSICLPSPPYLVGVLIHRYEISWARVFPLRLVLRLGALYRYYPSPLISVRNRNSVYYEIGQTIMNFLADFRNFSYTIETIRGLNIHMEDRKTSVLIPKNRYDSIIKVINNSTDHILAFGGDFSKRADGHLVCIQNLESLSETVSYSTQAINIQGQPRKVTGASFFILNGALKQNSGLSGKCSIVEDGLMVQITSTKMASVRESLKSMRPIEILCGPTDSVDEKQTEIVSIEWIENDLNFNQGVLSPIDKKSMNGIPSIRVHTSSLDMYNKFHVIRWTEVFILKSDEEVISNRSNRSINEDQINISKISEQIARSTCVALVNFLDLLAANGMTKIGLRVNLDPENVSYEAGCKSSETTSKFPPLYMNALDNELIGALHRLAVNLDSPIILELIFHILNK